jgi:type I restriction enzyme S subunit
MTRKSPLDWISTTVGDACSIRNDLRLPISRGERATMDGRYPYYGPTGQLDAIADFRLDGQFALIGEDGDHFLDVEKKSQTLLVSGKFNVNNHAHVIESTELCGAEWFYNYFRHRSIKPYLTRQGAGRYKLNKAALQELPIVLPPAQEQEAINALFREWDTAIQKTEHLIAANVRHYSGLVGRLVNGRSKSEVWRHVSIRDIANRVQRQGGGGDYPLLTISSASGFIRQEDRYSRYMAGESAKTYTLLRAGEFSYNKGNSKRYEFGCVFQLQNYDAALVPSVYVSFRLHDSVCSAFMRHLFIADYLKPQLRALVKTGVRNNGLLNISPDEFLSTIVPLPPLDQQTQIAKALDAASAEIDLLKRQLAALRVQKRGLMQKLLTGQWRMPVPESVKESTHG